MAESREDDIIHVEAGPFQVVEEEVSRGTDREVDWPGETDTL